MFCLVLIMSQIIYRSHVHALGTIIYRSHVHNNALQNIYVQISVFNFKIS